MFSGTRLVRDAQAVHSQLERDGNLETAPRSLMQALLVERQSKARLGFLNICDRVHIGGPSCDINEDRGKISHIRTN